MAENTSRVGDLITFLRKRDYRLVRELGQGACGQTVLLYDEQIDQHFVCKKYVPFSSSHNQELFANFVREIKLLHQVYHQNVVRVFNHYLYPEQLAGYILMEYIDGTDIDEFLSTRPELTNEVFLQTIRGFSHLEQSGILHRDIRPGNLMVTADGILKVIDLGFGKRVETPSDFDKSITLNWWCEPPDEFKESRYDFQTEVYFVGKLFERIIRENQISHFKYMDVLRRMSDPVAASRIGRFDQVVKSVEKDLFIEIEFTDSELNTYRQFAADLHDQIVKIERGTKYTTDLARIQTQLDDAYRSFMLDTHVPEAAVVLRCFLVGSYQYKKFGFPVAAVRNFVMLLKSVTDEKKRIILTNLHTKLDAIPRYDKPLDDDIPF